MTEMTTFMQPVATGKSKAEVSLIAEAYAARVGFQPGDRLEPLIERLGGRVTYMKAFENIEEDGSLLVWNPRDFEIKLSAFTGAERDRFTLAHELGHFVLHSGEGARCIRAARFGSDRVEWEANWFAAAFLMPEQDFRATCYHYSGNPQLIASRYMVSPKAVEVRKQNLGL